MKKIFYGLVLCSIGLLPAVSGAEELKLGFVNAAKLLEDAPQAAAARSKLEKEFAPRDKELVSTQKAIKSAEDKLAGDSGKASDAERVKAERDLISQKRDLKRAQDEFREDFNIRRNEEFGRLQKLVYETIVSLAKQENYDLIVGDGAIYASNRVDMTERVLERLKGGKGEPAAASKAEPAAGKPAEPAPAQ